MKYRIVITQFEPNPDYDKQLQVAQDRQGWNNETQWPVREIEMHKLDTVLTEAEFHAVRKACLEQM